MQIINHIRQTLTSNPSECFILEGYSQGAAATVDAMNQLSSGSEFKAIRGVFLVGDPRHKAGLSCNVDINGGDSTRNVDGVEAGDPTIPSAYVSKSMDVCNYVSLLHLFFIYVSSLETTLAQPKEERES